MPEPFLPDRFRAGSALMPHRIREVLLVSSHYDAFILEEDGYLTERIFASYRELNITSAPRVTHAASVEEALATLKWRRIDLVIAMRRVADTDVVGVSEQIRALYPDIPVVFLALDARDLLGLPEAEREAAFDLTFLWTGDASILLAIVKVLEDRKNVDHDIDLANVRVVIVVEDSVRYYSKFLGVMFTALLGQAQTLLREGLNDVQRLMRIRTRPKILIAHNYDDAVELVEKYQDNLMALVSDIRYPRRGMRDPHAGYRLAELVRLRVGQLPILLQSTDPVNLKRARRLSAHFLDKKSPHLLQDLRTFLTVNLGFGPFIFRQGGGGREVARATEIAELARAVEWVPEESLRYHLRHNHLATWLMTRGEFAAASRLRFKSADEIDAVTNVRSLLSDVLRAARREHRRGAITEYAAGGFEDTSLFIRLGEGSVGGKARGVAFMNAILARKGVGRDFPELPIAIPQTVVVCTGVFDEFLEINNLRELAYHNTDDERLRRRFGDARFPETTRNELRAILEKLLGPLAVRSSSVLEDSAQEPFAGVYRTFMITNEGSTDARLNELCQAIKMVYASTYETRAQAYIERTPHRIEEERMAVVIQRLVGRQYGDHFYPQAAGVAQSINHYPMGRQKQEDGVAIIALGLGRQIVEGGQGLRFAPKRPRILPQLNTPKLAMRQTQNSFWALDLSASRPDLTQGEEATLVRCELALAEEHGTLQPLASVYSAADDMIRDGLHHPGPRLVTFRPLLANRRVPLAKALARLLEVSKQGVTLPVELEFALDNGPKGAELFVLQMRPMAHDNLAESVDVEQFTDDQVICRSTMTLGSGVIDNARDVIYVKPEEFEPKHTRTIAQQVGVLNKQLNRPYILIGPGRWGSSDHWLGIPVDWTQISRVATIVEVSRPDFPVDPSQGAHFFQNITSLRVGYLTVGPHLRPTELMNQAVLDEQPVTNETAFLRHIRFDEPLTVLLDGVTGRGVILRPGETHRDQEED